MSGRSVLKWLGAKLDALFPSAVLRHRGYVLMLIPVWLLWGIGLALICVWSGSPHAAQELINGTIYVALALGGASLALRAWTEASKTQLKVLLAWSPIGIVSYLVLGGGIVGLLSTVLGIWIGPGAGQIELSFFFGGLMTMYAWYRTNRWALRQIRNSV